jgi:uncharacterized protein YjiS (DUF1127 family)
MLAKLYDRIVALLRQRQAYNELRHLDERMLRDIGLDRGQLSRY